MFIQKLSVVVVAASLSAGCTFTRDKVDEQPISYWDQGGSTSQPAQAIAQQDAALAYQTVESEARSMKMMHDGLASQERIAAPPFVPTPPAVHNREGYDVIIENRFLEVALSPVSTFGLDVDTASYSNVRRWIDQGSLPPVDAVRVEELINYFDYDYPQPKDGHPVAVTTELGVCPWNPAYRLAVVGVKASDLAREEAPANRLVFLIDTSGSMGAADKLPLLKKSFSLLVEQLKPQDQVAIVAYAGSAGLVLPPTSARDKGRIYQALGQLNSGGSTAGGQGIELAYSVAQQQYLEGANNRVLIATDGDFNVGQSSDGELVRMIEARRDQGVFLTVMGFGSGNYQDGKMQKLAGHGNGVHFYIDSEMEASRVFRDKLTSSLVTVAKDSKIQIEWNPERVASYRLIGYENRLLATEDFADDKKDAGDIGAGHTVTAIYEIVPRRTQASGQPLRYQESTLRDAPQREIGWLKFRYKQPESAESVLFEQAIMLSSDWLPNKPSRNFEWAVSAAEFAMLLRGSEHLGQASWAELQSRVNNLINSGSSDPQRAEFLRLVTQAQQLQQERVTRF